MQMSTFKHLIARAYVLAYKCNLLGELFVYIIDFEDKITHWNINWS